MPQTTGHQSIVNTALMHPHLLHVVTSGIERTIVLHSPAPNSPCAANMSRTPTDVRPLPDTNAESSSLIMQAMGLIPARDPGADDDSSTVALFDEILRHEGRPDVFDVRRFNEQSDSEDEAMDEDT